MVYIESFNAEPAVKLGIEPYLFPHAMIENCHLGRYTEVRDYAHLSDTRMDDYSYVSEYTQIAESEIGKFVNIAAQVRINPGFHPFEMPCQHHLLYRREMYGLGGDDQAFFNYRRSQKVSIGHDVWIGHGAIIMPGVNIGHGAIVGANAVVTKDVPNYAIVAGVSAKVLKFRFNPQVQKQLLRIAWWDWSHEQIKARIDDLRDIRALLYKYAVD